MARPKRNATASTSKAATKSDSITKKSPAVKKAPIKKAAIKKAPIKKASAVKKSLAVKKSPVKKTPVKKVPKNSKASDISNKPDSPPQATILPKTPSPEPQLADAAKPKRAEVVFSFDTTASMYPCLTQVRRKIKECVERLFKEIGTDNLRIGITAHGDYCCADQVYLTKHLPMTNNCEAIVQFVETVEATWGYTYPECYELVLHEAQNFAWMDDWAHVLVMIGDDVAHEKDDNPGSLDWREEVDKLKAMGVTIHGVQALNRKHATNFYAELARRTGGCHLPLDQFSSIVDLVMAVCYREAAQTTRLQEYELEVQAQPGRYNRATRYLFDMMLGRAAASGPPPAGMNAVHPGRFQVLDVDNDAPIKEFVLKQGVTFKKGRGFYEFNKPETIQKYKEIIIMDKRTGDMFEGAYARTLLGLPANEDAKIKPADHEYFFFIQSTSYNRKLVGGTRFLYEVPNDS